MLVLLSPAKKQNFDPLTTKIKTSAPLHKKQITELVKILKQYKPTQLEKLMNLSKSLVELNYHRFQQFNPNRFDLSNSKPAVFAFRGDAYRALDVDSLDSNTLAYMQKHLIILSGLYGCLRPLDLIQPYRLEMKTALKNPHGKDLYEFWQTQLTEQINKITTKEKYKYIINLASNEYFKVLQPKNLKATLINVEFKEKTDAGYKVIGIHAKRARGLMTRYIMENKISSPDVLKNFNLEKYKFNTKMSKENILTFTRGK